MSDSILDDVRAAAGQGGDAGEADTGDAAADIVADVAQAADAVEAAPEAAEEPQQTAAERARDQQTGRFTKKQQEEAAAAAAAPKLKAPPKPMAPAKAPPAAEARPLEQQAPPAEVKPAAPALKAPQAWTPAAREAFAKAPPEVQAEVDRREREMARFAQQSAPHRQLGEGFARVLEPYRALLTDEPLKVVGNLLQTAAQLQTAPPAHRAQLVARIVREYGVDIHELDEALAGAGAAPQPGQGPQQRGPGAQPMDARAIAQQVRQELLQEAQERRAQGVQQAGAKAVEDFVSSAPEFLEDVRQDMADLVEMAARRGVELSLKDAYTRAVQMHPEVSQVLQQREAAKAANAHTASTQSKRDAASSVRSKPAGVVVPKSGASVLDDVEAAAAALSGR